MRTCVFSTAMRPSLGRISLLACLSLAAACGQSNNEEATTGGHNAGGAEATGGNSSSSGGSEASGGTASTGGDAAGSGGADTGGTAPTGGTEAGTGGSEAGISCDTRKLSCKRATPPACPEGDVHAIVSGCYGDCVPIESCSCTSQDECPDPQGIDEFACHMSSGHCGYLVR